MKKKLFNIYHPSDGSLNHSCEKGKYEYSHITSVLAEDIEKAYELAQNFNEEYAKLNKRSTSVGDIIIDDEDDSYMIMPIGIMKL